LYFSDVTLYLYIVSYHTKRMGSIIIRGGNWIALKKFQYWW